MAAVDRNTGQQATPYGNAQDFVQSQSSGPQTTTSGSSSVQTTSGTTSGRTASYQLNTTPEAREALNNFIQQLSDRNVVSDTEASAQYPLAVAKFDSKLGWYYTNPISGLTMSSDEAARFNSQQQAKQQAFIQQGGTIAGGTQDQRALTDARMQEIERNRATQAGYTKDAAFADAKMLSDYFTRVLTEQQMPGILRGAEGSGASKGTTRALLTEQAIQRSSENAANVGIQAATSYGNINNQLAQVLEALTRQDPNSISNQLLQALGVAKGIETTGVQAQTGTTNQTTNTQTTGQQQQSGQQQTVYRDYITPTNAAGSSVVATPDAYKPSSFAGTGYIVANSPDNDPYADIYAAAAKNVGQPIYNYGSNDSDVIIGE